MPPPTDTTKASYMFSDDLKFLQKAIVFHPSGDTFLAVKRCAEERSRPNKWDLVGGNVSYGEQHEESLRREIKEETGLDTGDLLPLQVLSHVDSGIYYLFIGYKTTASSATVVLSKEHTEYKWVTKEEFLKLDCGADFLHKLVKLM